MLNCGHSALQLVTGVGFGSLAPIGDALHNLGDVVVLFLSGGASGSASRVQSVEVQFTTPGDIVRFSALLQRQEMGDC